MTLLRAEELSDRNVRPGLTVPRREYTPSEHSRSCLLDKALLDRCRAGETDAWRELYEEHHMALLRMIASMLQRTRNDDLTEEIASRVWLSLAENSGEILDRYDPNRGARFVTLLRLIARDELKSHLRSEGRRKHRELIAGTERSLDSSGNPALWTDFESFVAKLTDAEKRFLNSVLLPACGEPLDAEETYTRGNSWQLKHRIRSKLTTYLGL